MDFITDLLNVVDVSTVDKSVVVAALNSGLSDFEDAIQVGSAKQENIQTIVTRNEADFLGSGMDVYSPERFLNSFTA